MSRNSNAEVTTKLPRVIRTAEGLREALFDEIDALRANEITVGHARAFASLVKRILSVAKMELQHKKALGQNKESMQLGAKK